MIIKQISSKELYTCRSNIMGFHSWKRPLVMPKEIFIIDMHQCRFQVGVLQLGSRNERNFAWVILEISVILSLIIGSRKHFISDPPPNCIPKLITNIMYLWISGYPFHQSIAIRWDTELIFLSFSALVTKRLLLLVVFYFFGSYFLLYSLHFTLTFASFTFLLCKFLFVIFWLLWR